jgi:hypothetical protein
MWTSVNQAPSGSLYSNANTEIAVMIPAGARLRVYVPTKGALFA